jgi:beta-phosphoglucomutase-like phosphatase (HAD superfamily)
MSGTTLFQAVLFDMDGLIVDTEPLHFRAFQTLMAKRGVALHEDIMGDLVGYDHIVNLRDFKVQYNLDEPLEPMLDERQALYEEIILTQPVLPMAGFWEAGEACRRLGIKRAIVSSSVQRQVDMVLGRLFEHAPNGEKYLSYFDDIVCGDQVAETKPAPDLYRSAAQRLGLAPVQCLALEDTPVGVQAANAAGVPCIAVPSIYVKVELFSGQLATLGSLREVIPYLQNGR